MPPAVALRKSSDNESWPRPDIAVAFDIDYGYIETAKCGLNTGHPMMRALLSVATVGICVLASLAPSVAADLPVSGRGVTQQAWCGPCGCLRVDFDHHRELRSTYGTGFDPRNYDETQPHYYFGAMRAYPRYSVEDCASGPY
jgi:hypothetical protein